MHVIEVLVVVSALFMILGGTLGVVSTLPPRAPRLPPVIPRTLWVTAPWTYDVAPPHIRAALASWTAIIPKDVTLQWFDDTAARTWIQSHFPQYLAEYDVLLPGAFRADVWRLLVLWEHGGMYTDAGTLLHVDPWALAGPAALLMVRDGPGTPGASVFQGLIGATRNHPVIAKMIDRVISNIRARRMGKTCVATTGPMAVGPGAVLALGARGDKWRKPDDRWIPGHYGDVLLLKYEPDRIVYTPNSQKVLTTKVPGYYDTLYKTRGTTHYREMWTQGRVYKDIPVSSKQPISAYIWRTAEWPSTALPQQIQKSMASFSKFAPEFQQVYMDDAGRSAFVAAEFPQYAAAFESVVPGAYRADLWRLLVVLRHGGVYSDICQHLVAPLGPLLAGHDAVFVLDEPQWVRNKTFAIFNGFFAARPGHPLLAAIVDQVMADVRARQYNKSPLDIAGPWAWGRAFQRVYGLQDEPNDRLIAVAHLMDVVMWRLPGHIKDLEGSFVETRDGRRVIATRPDAGFRSLLYANVPKYSHFWVQRTVYK